MAALASILLLLLIPGCMLMHLTDDHHSGMMGHDSKGHGGDKNHRSMAHQQAVLLDQKPRKDSQGGVTVEVRFKEFTDKGELAFRVQLSDHSIAIATYRLEDLAILRNDQGVQVCPSKWGAVNPTMQQVVGTLHFPAKDPEGRPLLGQGARKVILTIRELAGIRERVFEWSAASSH